MSLLSFQSPTNPEGWDDLQALVSESIESSEAIVSPLSLETNNANSPPTARTLFIRHNSSIPPKNLDQDWYKSYPARAHVRKLVSSEDTELDVVCKIKRGHGIEELRDEYDCYIKLRDLQGQEIPKCYGLFRSSGNALSRDRATRRSTWACLVLAYCGKRLPNNLICMPWEFKLGVIHRDLRTLGNVIVSDDGKPIITEAIPFHIHVPFDQPCYELGEAAEATWLWKARSFMSKLGIPIPVCVIENDEMTLEEKIVNIMELYTPQEVHSPTPIDFRKAAENEIKRYELAMEMRRTCQLPPAGF
ncbi:hypothetical protein POSPLADRAFT_1157039 [Postia placenta MAD-698-R-SB12]|uniref:Uncharacterized protein n=1 Tax=Postia placenta MAD-698-R-SB12 TaxID=670580 RepID=A0A1X6MMR8_9APHY|nr:hypothetical protein POSPLADRAFT_1157039 [Postia placenta MAD-698-R-SB12]OSX57482.1 hypothetical protein POSPLADRAFT_1157039 [Postia placenta MAD-698-R-SB12]